MVKLSHVSVDEGAEGDIRACASIAGFESIGDALTFLESLRALTTGHPALSAVVMLDEKPQLLKELRGETVAQPVAQEPAKKRERKKANTGDHAEDADEPVVTPAEQALATDTAAQQRRGGTVAEELLNAKNFRDVMTYFNATAPLVECRAYFEAVEGDKAEMLKAAVDAVHARCEAVREHVQAIARADKSSLRARIERALELDDLQQAQQ